MRFWYDEDEDGDEYLSEYLDSDLSFSDQDEGESEEEERLAKRFCRQDDKADYRHKIVGGTSIASSGKAVEDCSKSNANTMEVKRIESGILSKIPPELFYHILKLLSSEDLISCSRVCKFMNHVASDGSLWRRLYRLRWGLLPPTARLRECAWKTLYIQQDEADLFVATTNCRPEFKEYYIQMHSAMRSESPLPSQDEEGSEEEERPAERFCREDDKVVYRQNIVGGTSIASSSKAVEDCSKSKANKMEVKRIESGVLSKIPPELFNHILKFLSSEDLISCSRVCKFMNHVASDGSLWRRLYCLRWGLLPPTTRLRECAWKTLYIQQDEADLFATTWNCQPEFKEYYIQMHSAMRSESPLPSQVNDDPVDEQIDICKTSKGSNGKAAVDHTCSGESCSFHKIRNAFVCEKTGNVHVCDERCQEAILDPKSELWVCRVSGRCFDPLSQSPSLMLDSGIVGQSMKPSDVWRAYLLAFSCNDKEWKAAMRFR